MNIWWRLELEGKFGVICSKQFHLSSKWKTRHSNILKFPSMQIVWKSMPPPYDPPLLSWSIPSLTLIARPQISVTITHNVLCATQLGDHNDKHHDYDGNLCEKCNLQEDLACVRRVVS